MFITNQLTPVEMLSELLSLPGRDKTDTVRFRKLGHDKHLCPAYRDRVEAMLTAYKAHRTDVQDVQGMRDEGVDVDLRYYLDGPQRAGLQIKSFSEIEKWAKKRDRYFIKTLKAQVLTALKHLDCADYYVLLCTDEILHQKQIRTITSELKQIEEVRVILPHHALALYEVDDESVSVFVTQTLCEHDAVLAAAMREASRLPADRAFVQLALLCLACDGQASISQQELMEIYDEWLESSASGGSSDDIGEVISDLDGDGFCYSAEGGDDRLAIGNFPTAWCALYFDQLHRYRGDVRRRLSLLLGIVPPSF